MDALRLSRLAKTFGPTRAVDDLSMAAPAGSFFGLVGQNGAGKTTTLSMAVGLLRPARGRAEVFGCDVWSEPMRAKTLIGVLPDAMSLPERLTAREFLRYAGLLRRLAPQTVAARAKELLEVLQLERADNRLLIDFSTGMHNMIGLASALLHAPRLLVLDEPFEAVDPNTTATIREILQRFVARGGSVIFSS